MEIHSKEVFKSPPLREQFGAGACVLIGVFLLVTLFLAGLSLWINKPTAAVSVVLLVLMTFAGLMLELWLFRGEIALEEDGLVEYYPLNRTRKFLYAQIYEVKPGSKIDLTYIRYYALQADGQIDYQRFKGTHLMGVKDNQRLQFELARRMSAPPPENLSPWMPGSRQVVVIVLLLGLILLALISYLLLTLY